MLFFEKEVTFLGFAVEKLGAYIGNLLLYFKLQNYIATARLDVGVESDYCYF